MLWSTAAELALVSLSLNIRTPNEPLPAAFSQPHSKIPAVQVIFKMILSRSQERVSPRSSLVGLQTGSATVKISVENSQNVKHKSTIRPSYINCSLAYARRTDILLHRSLSIIVYCCSVLKSLENGYNHMPTTEQMDNTNMVHT